MKKWLPRIIGFSNLILLIIFAVLCVITTSLSTKPKDYSDLTEYTSTLTLSDEVQICNIKELYIKNAGGYSYANIFSDDTDVPILTYRGKRLNFQFESEVIEYNGNAPAKCRIISRDSRITGSFEFELRPKSVAEKELKMQLYMGYLISGIVISVVLALLKIFVTLLSAETPLSEQDELEKDLFFAIKKYDFRKQKNEDVKLYVTKVLGQLGFQSEKELIDKKDKERREKRKELARRAVAEYCITSGWLCGITALIVSNFVFSSNMLWSIFILIAAMGYVLKYVSFEKLKKKKEEK